MIEIKNIKIEYHKLILECPLLKFPNQGFCVIKGESGSGKTSLIHCLTMKNNFYETYFYNNQEMSKTIVEQKISVLNQNQEFIEDMSVIDHIKIIEKSYSFPNKDDYISRLELDSLLDKYPNQISGGEKTRVGLLLRMMKMSDILILDEPTASLDLYYTHIVSEIMKEYAKNHLVIVCTHDKEIIHEADILYEIKNQKLLTLHKCDIEIITEQTDKNHSRFPIFSLNLKIKKKHKFYYTGLFVGLAFLILISSFGLSVQMTSSLGSHTLSSLYQDELLVYKSKYGFSAGGYEFPFTEDEIIDIKSMSHVKDIQECYIYKNLSEIVEEKENYLDFDGEDHCWISLYSQGQKQEKVDYRSGGYSGTLGYCSFNESYDYSQDIDVVMNNKENGVYISKALADFLKIDISKKDYDLEFTLMVPIYQIYGDAILPYENENGSYDLEGDPLLEWMGVKEKVRLPINGVLKSSNMGVGINEYLSIYFPNQLIQSYINNNKVKESVQYYWVDAKGRYEKEVSKNEVYSKTIIAKPYEPIVFRLKLDDIVYMEEVAKELEEKGFSVVKGDYSFSIQMYKNNNDQMILTLSMSLLIIFTMIYALIQYLRTYKDYQIKDFVESFGIKEANKIINKKYLIDFLIMDVLICMMGIMYIFLIGPLLNYPVHFTDIFILIALIMSFIIMYIVPMLVYKLRK